MVRRDCAADSLIAWFTGGHDFGWNATLQGKVATNGGFYLFRLTFVPVYVGNQSFVLPVQLSFLSVAACRPAADPVYSALFYHHLNELCACGHTSHVPVTSSRFSHLCHISDVNTLSSHIRSALVRLLMCALKVVLCSGRVCGP